MRTTATIPVYGGPMVSPSGEPWPESGHRLIAELASARDRFALIAAEPSDADRLVARLAADLDLVVAHLGPALASSEHPPTIAQLEAACAGATIVTDLDLLLWPALGVPALPFLGVLARRRPVIAVWPGAIADRRARYSLPGRPDYYDQRLVDVVVLRPRASRFSDEVPYQIERVTR